MIRAPMGNPEYWNRWVMFGEQTIQKNLSSILEPSGNPMYEAQFVWDSSVEYPRLAITRYSRGDPIRDLSQHFVGLLNAWELSNRLSDEICSQHNLAKCRDWTFDLTDLNHYNWCFWLVGLALALEIPDEQWRRLLALIGGEGKDALLDRIIASHEPGRKIGKRLLHNKPYARLLKAINTAQENQAALLRDFVDHWYAELNRKGRQQPWWYIYGDPEKHPLEKGSYFGRWCIEAVAAVKAFGLDDRLCLGHEHYPGDLLRPDGPSTHPARHEPKPNLWGRFFKRDS
jgi:hypothetical protein